MHIGVTWRIRLNHPYVKLLWPLVSFQNTHFIVRNFALHIFGFPPCLNLLRPIESLRILSAALWRWYLVYYTTELLICQAVCKLDHVCVVFINGCVYSMDNPYLFFQSVVAMGILPVPSSDMGIPTPTLILNTNRNLSPLNPNCNLTWQILTFLMKHKWFVDHVSANHLLVVYEWCVLQKAQCQASETLQCVLAAVGYLVVTCSLQNCQGCRYQTRK